MKGQHWLQRPSILHFESLCIILTRIYCHQQERNHERQRRKHTIYHNSASSKNAKQRDVCIAIRMAGPTPPKTNIDSSNKNTLRNTWQTEEAKQRKRMKDKLCKFMKLCKKPSCSLYSLHKTTRYSGENEHFSNAANHTLSIVHNFGSCTVLQPQIPLALVHPSQAEFCDLDFTTDHIIPSRFHLRSLAYQPIDSDTKESNKNKSQA